MNEASFEQYRQSVLNLADRLIEKCQQKAANDPHWLGSLENRLKRESAQRRKTKKGKQWWSE